MGYTGLGRELEGLLPVKNLLPSNVSLGKGCWTEYEERGGGGWTDRAADKGWVPEGTGISRGVASNGGIRSHPYKHSNMITPRDHQSQEKV